MFRTEGNDLCKSDGQTGLSAARLALSLSVKTDGGGGRNFEQGIAFVEQQGVGAEYSSTMSNPILFSFRFLFFGLFWIFSWNRFRNRSLKESSKESKKNRF